MSPLVAYSTTFEVKSSSCEYLYIPAWSDSISWLVKVLPERPPLISLSSPTWLFSMLATMSEIIEPTIRGMAEMGHPFSGVFFAGLMITDQFAKLMPFTGVAPRIIKCTTGDA